MLHNHSVLAHTAFTCQDPPFSLTCSTQDGIIFNKSVSVPTLTPRHYTRSLPSWHLTNKQTNTIIQQQTFQKKYKLLIKKLFPLFPHLLKKLAFLLNILPLKSLLLWPSRKLTARGLILQAQLGIQFGSINKAIVFVWSDPIQHNNMAIIYTGESIHLWGRRWHKASSKR